MNKLASYFKNNFFPLFLIFIFTIITLLYNWSSFSTPDNPRYYSDRYSRSQYILGDSAPDKIPDYIVYIYAGQSYLKGEDPTTINFEHPPFGKYVLGFSGFLFGNSILINLGLFFFSFVLFYHLLGRVTKVMWLKTLALILLFGMQIMTVYTGFGLLDIQQLFYTLLFFSALFLKTDKKVLKYILVGIFLGMIASVKYPITLLPLFVPIILYYSHRQKQFKLGLLALIFSGIFYLLTYTMYFLNGHSLLDFLRFEKYRFDWWTGERTIPKFLILQTIFTGRFKGWWGENVYEYASAWNLAWPMVTVFGVACALVIKKNLELWLISFYSLGLFAMYIFGSASNERYLIQLFPFWIILMIAFIEARQQAK